MWKVIQGLPRTAKGSLHAVFRGAQQNAEINRSPLCQCHYVTNEGVRGNSHKDKKKEKSEEPDRNWFQEYVRQKYASSAIEAFGLSTALVLGIQLSHLWHLHNRSPESRHLDPDTRHRLCRLYQLAVSMPLGNTSYGTCKSVLPIGSGPILPSLPPPTSQQDSSSTSSSTLVEFEGEKAASGSIPTPNLTSQKRDFKTLIDDLVFPLDQFQFPQESDSESRVSSSSSEEEEESEYSCSSSDAQDARPEVREQKSEVSDLPFPDFAKEWQELLDTYYGIQGNEQGLQHAQEADFTSAFESWKSSADKTGYARANFNVGLCYEMGKGVQKDFKKACEYYNKAADSGHAKAAYNLAILQLQRKVPLPEVFTVNNADSKWRDPRQLLQQAAESGSVEAMTELGVTLLEAEEDREGARWLTQAALSQECSSADYYLGVCYEQGIGVAADSRQAVDHYHAASKQGHPRALYTMAQYHETGRAGLSPDKQTALQYYREAYEAGYKPAHADVDRLHTQLQQERLGTAMECLLGPPPSYSSLRSHSSPSLSHYFSQRLLSCDSGFSSPENSDGFLADLAQQMARERDKMQGDKMGESEGKLEVTVIEEDKKAMKKSQSTSSMANMRLKLLLGETASLLNVGPEENVPKTSKSCVKDKGVGFSIGGGDGWNDGLVEDSSTSDSSLDAQDEVGLNLSGQFGMVKPKKQDLSFGSFATFVPDLNIGSGSFGQVASLQRK